MRTETNVDKWVKSAFDFINDDSENKAAMILDELYPSGYGLNDDKK
jgi:hypothetical protein